MKPRIRILFILSFTLLMLDSCGIKTELCKGKIENLEYQNTYLRARKYKGVIFSKDYDVFGIINNSANKFTPTLSEIDSAENILRRGIKEINKNRPNQFDNCPVIDKHLRKYIRQYFGLIENGQKIILINCFWERKGFYGFWDKYILKEPEDNKWKTEEKVVMDGCSYYWSIKVNLKEKTLYEFGVNGIG